MKWKLSSAWPVMVGSGPNQENWVKHLWKLVLYALESIIICFQYNTKFHTSDCNNNLFWVQNEYANDENNVCITPFSEITPIIRFFFNFCVHCTIFIIIRRYSRAYVALVYSDFSGGWNHSARGLVNHKAPTAEQILVRHMSCHILLLQRNPCTSTISPVAKHLSADGQSAADITPPGTQCCKQSLCWGY